MSAASPKRPMTPEEIEAIDFLKGVRFPVASFDKRFASTLYRYAAMTPPIIGEKMAPQLWRLFIRYRRQYRAKDPKGTRRIPLFRIAEQLTAPEFRSVKYRVAVEYEARLKKLKEDAAKNPENFQPQTNNEK